MDLVDFDWALKRMRKERILRLKQILLELYAFERNKYEISKLLKMTAQAIGPEIDLLENLNLIKQTRVVEKHHIPSKYYALDLEEMIDKLDFLDGNNKNLLFALLERFQHVYAILKEMENESKIGTDIESFYGGIVPTDLNMLILQILQNLFIILTLVFDLPLFSSTTSAKFLEQNPELVRKLEVYGTELKSKLPPPEEVVMKWIEKNNKAITSLFEQIWMQLFQKIIFTSMVKEPFQSLSLINKAEKLKKSDLRKEVEKRKRHPTKKTKLDDLINEDGKEKNNFLKRIQPLLQKITSIQTGIEDQKLSQKLNKLHSRLNFLPDKARNAPLGLLNKSEKEKIDVLTIKVAILTTLSEYTGALYELLQDLEREIEFESENYPKILAEIFTKAPALEELTNWYEVPNEFIREPVTRKLLKGKELESQVNEFVSTLSEKTSVIEFIEFIQKFHDENPAIAASLKDLKKVLEKLRKDNLIIGLEKFKDEMGSVEIVRLKSTDADQNLILELARKSPELRVTLEQMRTKLDFSPVRARAAIQDMKDIGYDVRPDSTHEEGDLWYFPGLKED